MIIQKKILTFQKIRARFEDSYQGKANQLSTNWHKWDILEKIEDASFK